MNKKQITALATCVATVAIAVVGGTLAYFTDTDKVDNTFSIGNVQIAIEETFDKENAKLIPGKDINKDVYVKNTGSNDAYVRVHIAIPTSMDDGDPAFNASKNFLHFNFTNASVADGQWSWLPTYSTGVGYKGNGAGNWNFYTTKIDGVDYNVYIVTYRSILKANEKTTTQALDKVYLDATVDATVGNDGKITYKDTKGNEVTMGANDTFDIKVFAEAVQSEGFTDAYDAFSKSFTTTPSETANPWNNYGATTTTDAE